MLLEYIDKTPVQVIMTSEISRIGRRVVDVLNFVELLHEKGIALYIQQFNLLTMENGKENPVAKMLLQMLSIGAEMENNQRKIRQIEGIQLAKLKGVYNGRVKGSRTSVKVFFDKYQNVNDLLDKRDALVDELSNIVNINVVYDNTNSAVISIGGALAVDRMHSSVFVAEEVNGKLNLKIKDGSYPIVLTGGELNALSQVYSKKIPAYQEKLDAVINKLVEAVNVEHVNGYTITDPQETGLNFFEGYVNGELVINQELLDDPNKIAISLDGTEGNGEIALRIAQLTDAALLDGNTLQESYSSMINGLGNDGMLQNNYTQANQMVLDELAQLRASQSGVSVDEEMTNVLKFQRTYEASAKLITIADEILQTILNMV